MFEGMLVAENCQRKVFLLARSPDVTLAEL